MSGSAAGADEPPCTTGDCVLEKVLAGGACKAEFLAFDSCYEEANGNDEACASLFDAFRGCMAKMSKTDAVNALLGK